MSIDGPADLEGLRAAGRVVAEAIRAMRARVQPGVSTEELDRVGARVFAATGARSAPRQAYDFPGATCISVNDEAAHGVPGRRRLRHGDLVKLDVSAELNGYYADACVSVPVGMVGRARLDLAVAAEAALFQALAIARAGTPIDRIGHTVESVAAARGFSVCRDLTGHGIGREIHEWPTVFHCTGYGSSEPLTAGMVITIEPAISAGAGATVFGEDGWTIRTADGSCAAQFEHTLVVTDDVPILLTV